MDRWEEGFDTWVPPASAAVDARAEDEREQLLRLARELGAARDAAHQAELEPLKQALREAVEAAAAHERELAELRRRLEAELAAAQAARIALEQERPSFAEGVAALTQKTREGDPASTPRR
jgi:regulator of replication initiation timing